MSFIGKARSPPIVYDMLRLFLAAADRTPRGIDRIDLAYARFLFGSWPGDCAGLLPTPWGLRLYDRARVLRGLDRIEMLWSETNGNRPDDLFISVQKRMSGGKQPDSAPVLAGRQWAFRRIRRFASLLSATGLARGDSITGHAAERALYLNVGQLGWAAPWMTSWLRRRPDIRAIFMIHDVIPLEHPDLIEGPGPWAHRRMIDTASRHAAGIISTSAAAGTSVQRALRQRGRNDITVETMPLPVAPIFLDRPAPNGALARQTYFVICGAIEPRKNHRLLLGVWRKLVARHGAHAPKLVIAGSPARGAVPILRAFASCAELQDHLVIASGLSSPALRDLIAHSAALLMPSLAEGFGLPIIEALSLGTPVIASDIPAHREAGGDFAAYCDPTDEAAWLGQIDRLTGDRGHAAALRRKIDAYEPTTPRQHQERIASFLGTFA